MPKLSRFMGESAKLLYKICLYMTVAIALAMVIVVFMKVMFRYAMSSGFAWSEEISVLLMMWIAFFGGSLLFYDQSNIQMDFLVAKFPKNISRFLQWSYHIATILFLGLLFWYGMQFADQGRMSVFAASGIKKFWSYLSIPIGSFLGVYFELAILLRKIGHSVNGEGEMRC